MKINLLIFISKQFRTNCLKRECKKGLNNSLALIDKEFQIDTNKYKIKELTNGYDSSTLF